MSRILLGYILLGVLGVASAAILIAVTSGCGTPTCGEGPLLFVVFMVMFYAVGFAVLGAIWLITELIAAHGASAPTSIPPMPRELAGGDVGDPPT